MSTPIKNRKKRGMLRTDVLKKDFKTVLPKCLTHTEDYIVLFFLKVMV
jgi:hypothetical protein